MQLCIGLTFRWQNDWVVKQSVSNHTKQKLLSTVFPEPINSHTWFKTVGVHFTNTPILHCLAMESGHHL